MPVAAWPAIPALRGLKDLRQAAHSIFDRVPFMYPSTSPVPAANVPCGFNAEKLPVASNRRRWHRESTSCARRRASRRSTLGAAPPLD
jgi:hypothetical protein